MSRDFCCRLYCDVLPMIAVRLQGGLGNQLFQYAIGRALADRWQVELKVDLQSFAESSERCYGLDNFRIRAEVASAPESAALRWRTPRWWTRLKWRLTGKQMLPFVPAKTRLVEASPNRYDTSVWRAGPDAYIEGYWQCWQYVREGGQQLAEDLEFRVPAGGANSRLAERICQGESVFVHVRRGDYISEAFAGRYAICSLEYYQRAMEMIATRVQTPAFYVFSDDMEWCRQHLVFPLPIVFVDGNDSASAHEDLRLMALCRHGITANSTLSWWAGWLGRWDGRVVCTPREWYRHGRGVGDLIPPDWIRL